MVIVNITVGAMMFRPLCLNKTNVRFRAQRMDIVRDVTCVRPSKSQVAQHKEIGVLFWFSSYIWRRSESTCHSCLIDRR